MTKDEKQRLVDVIARAIAAGEDLAALREAHGVQYHAWQRIVRSVKNGKAIPSKPATEDFPENVVRIDAASKPKTPRAKVGELIKAKDREMAAGRVPGRNHDEPVHFMAHIHRLFADCDEIEAWGRNEDGEIKDREGAFFINESMKRRISTLSLLVAAQEKRWVGHRMDLRQKAIMDAIADVDPATKAKIVERFRKIDFVSGITFDA